MFVAAKGCKKAIRHHFHHFHHFTIRKPCYSTKPVSHIALQKTSEDVDGCQRHPNLISRCLPYVGSRRRSSITVIQPASHPMVFPNRGKQEPFSCEQEPNLSPPPPLRPSYYANLKHDLMRTLASLCHCLTPPGMSPPPKQRGLSFSYLVTKNITHTQCKLFFFSFRSGVWNDERPHARVRSKISCERIRGTGYQRQTTRQTWGKRGGGIVAMRVLPSHSFSYLHKF